MKVLYLVQSVLENSNLEPMSDEFTNQIYTMCPLFQTLYETSKTSEIKMNWVATSSKLNTLTEKEMEIVYVLILCYYYYENKNFSDKKRMTPFKGKLMDGNKGILYTITDLPNRLQQIIFEFLEIIRN